MKVFFNDGYVAPGHGADTTRKSGEIAAAIEAGRLPGVELADPAHLIDLAEQLISTVHAPEYVEALQTGQPNYLATSQGFTWDEGIWEMAANSTAGASSPSTCNRSPVGTGAARNSSSRLSSCWGQLRQICTCA